jgi:hypothetical protein
MEAEQSVFWLAAAGVLALGGYLLFVIVRHLGETRERNRELQRIQERLAEKEKEKAA